MQRAIPLLIAGVLAASAIGLRSDATQTRPEAPQAVQGRGGRGGGPSPEIVKWLDGVLKAGPPDTSVTPPAIPAGPALAPVDVKLQIGWYSGGGKTGDPVSLALSVPASEADRTVAMVAAAAEELSRTGGLRARGVEIQACAGESECVRTCEKNGQKYCCERKCKGK